MTDPSKLISVRHIADMAGVARSTVTRAIQDGELKAERFPIVPDQPDKVWLGVEPADAERYIAEKKVQVTRRGRRKTTVPASDE